MFPEYDAAVTNSRNLLNGKRPNEILTNPENRVRINRADYMATRPGEIAAKADDMHNGAASVAHGDLVGDGARFRGRGFLQITGRKNYKVGHAKSRNQYRQGDCEEMPLIESGGIKIEVIET